MVKKLIMIFSLLIICCYLPAETMNWTIEKWQQIPNILGTVPRSVQWSPDGEIAAFLWNNEGYETLDIYLYYPYKKKLVKLTDIATLNTATDSHSDRNAARIKERMRIEGSGITSYIWHPDSNNIYFPYRGDIYRINIEERTTTRITRTEAEELDQKLSPDGKWLSFIRANDIWLLNLERGNEIQLTTTGSETILNGIGDYIALEELERYSSYFWSPRSDAILFVSADISPVRELIIPDYRGDYVKYVKQRRPRAGEPNAVQKVYTVSLNDPQPVLLDLLAQDDEYYVTRLRWSPDASTVLILKESRDLKKVDFILSSPASGQSKILYNETDQKWVNIRNQFALFSKDSKTIYFTSEKSGYNHLYSLDIESGTEQMLTQGKWEITEINGIDKDDEIYFTSTRISPSQRHLDLYDTEDNRIIQKTFVEGWHSCNLSPNFDDVAEIYSSNILPGELYHFSLSEPMERQQITRSALSEAENYKITKPRYFTINNKTDGKMIFARMWRPDLLEKNRKYPLIIAIHGGGYAQSVRHSWRYTDLFHNILLKEGYIVLDIDYRGSSGYGRDWRTDVYLNVGVTDLDDVISTVEYIRTRSYIDTNRIGIWGWSYGGFMTTLALTKTPDLFKTGAAVAPVNKWENYDSHYTEERFGKPQDNPAVYSRANPVTYASGLKGKLLLIHGMIDDNVHFQDTVLLCEAFIKSGGKFELMLYPGGLHGIQGSGYREHLFKTILDFFKKYL